MRAVRSATCTSGEPVSAWARWYLATISALLMFATAMFSLSNQACEHADTEGWPCREAQDYSLGRPPEPGPCPRLRPAAYSRASSVASGRQRRLGIQALDAAVELVQRVQIGLRRRRDDVRVRANAIHDAPRTRQAHGHF